MLTPLRGLPAIVKHLDLFENEYLPHLYCIESHVNYFLDKTASLTPLAAQIICHSATESPFSGHYPSNPVVGTYLCRRCGLALFRADSQFSSGCGWPSFDICIQNHVEERSDNDGQRTEIRCHRCEAHLGHVFVGEQFTANNKRYCVNALSVDFVIDNIVEDTEEMIAAGGCFWGVDHFLKQLPGVLKVEVGYTGGFTDHPTYETVCHHQTGHYEAVRVVFDREKTSYHALVQRFFEIHDPTQSQGQGPDIGQQYQSAIFYYDASQHTDINQAIQCLIKNGYSITTRVLPVEPFWPAEDYHQNYYEKHQKQPYCHQPVDRFHTKEK